MNPVVHAQNAEHRQPRVQIGAEHPARDALFDDRQQRLAVGVGVFDDALRLGNGCDVLGFGEQKEELGIGGKVGDVGAQRTAQLRPARRPESSASRQCRVIS